MRPITLTMEAFGPFSEQECIHFDPFREKGIFLITGPTGAGKTTIFDAMIYALYGVSSGDQRDGESFRSDHARPDQMTSVTLIFELKGKIYKVKRIPKQVRPKLSGEGFTVQMTDAELEGDGMILSGVKDVTEKINALFGLNAEQFRQIMMIPQGEFRRLILSDSREKSEIFRKLFGTALFERIQDQMKIEEDLLRNQHFETGAHIKVLLGQLSLTETLDPLRAQCMENAVIPNFKKLIEAVDTVIKTDEAQCGELKLQIEADVKRQDQMKLEIANQKQLTIQFEVLQQCRAKLKAHLKGESEAEMNKIRIKFAQKAERIDSEAKHKLEKEESYNVRKRAYEQIAVQYDHEEVAYNLSKKAFEGILALKEVHEKTQTQLMRLKMIREEVQALDLHQKRFEILQKEIETFALAHEQAIGDMEKLKEKIGETALKVSALQESKVKLAALSGQRTTLNHVISVFDDWNEREQQLEQREKTLTELAERIKIQSNAVSAARKAWQQLETQFMKGYSGILAKALKDQSPCPVCGSCHHPNPASEGAVISKAELDESRRVLEGQMNQFEKIKAEADALRSQNEIEHLNLNKLWKQFANQFSELFNTPASMTHKDEVQVKLSNYKTRLSEKESQYKRDIERASFLLNQQETQEKNLETFIKTQKSLEDKLNAHYLERESLKTKIDQITDKVPEQFLEYPILLAELKRLEKDLKQLSSEIQNISDTHAMHRETLNMLSEKKRLADEELNAAREKLKLANQVFDQVLAENDFDTVEAYRAAQLSRLEMERLSEQVETFYGQKQDLEKTLTAQSELLKGKQMQDTDILEEQLRAIEAITSTQRQRLNQMLASVSQNRKLISEINQLLLKLESISLKHAYVSKLARMARGQNAQRLSFENFVLSQYFEDVLNAANLRLHKMTTGRFELIRKREKSKGNAQSGLDIEVMDQYTGKLRHVKTLSGGETFKASLALALGLSDIVQRFSGGISLETMFIDEGFGTLDSDSLDKAIESLMSLSNHNRLVGIISHVQELKERIPSQLQVIQQIEGSHTQISLF
ncbi:AAA family ATPase [Fusibacter ferrireducens]|uniref:Nuclease SbcCD subunit C n=1 Tax=Fusibacter ferrireducens TaxID=2785058 RepID=A0ABR9ZYG4_9FIRM|nr:SMC family ATPase [Fusibacter ferrireducens]MBF4694996.1 SMC family ATPase [Fusibacter ferrireducens]